MAARRVFYVCASLPSYLEAVALLKEKMMTTIIVSRQGTLLKRTFTNINIGI